jgi:hypothetical protein
MGDISAFVRRSRNADRDDINKLLGLITPIAFAPPEEGGVQERIILDYSARKRTQSVSAGVLDVTHNQTRNYGSFQYRRQIPSTVNSYTLTHVTTNSFTPVKTTLSKFGAGCHGAGTGYVTVGNHSKLDLTTEITISTWLYPKASSGNAIILQKNGAYSLRIVNTNTIEFFINSKTPVTYTYTGDIDTWIHIFATYKSTSSGQKLYINNSLQSSDSESGAITTNTNDLKIAGDGSSNLVSGTVLAYTYLIGNEIDSTRRTNIYDGLYDAIGTFSEIVAVNFIGDERPTPLSESGLFRS